jgi:NAD(P)-dependent dehydrogenase (short-subunit alcohol dehydrogenase family)
MKTVLVSGGAGYIGSHTVQVLTERGYEAVVIDNLTTGFYPALSTGVTFYEGDISDAALVGKIVRKHRIDSVIHFAARSLVGESVAKPDLYFMRIPRNPTCSFPPCCMKASKILSFLPPQPPTESRTRSRFRRMRRRYPSIPTGRPNAWWRIPFTGWENLRDPMDRPALFQRGRSGIGRFHRRTS